MSMLGTTRKKTRDSKSQNIGQRERWHKTESEHLGQLETKHGTTEDKTRDSRRQPVEQQEARRETPGLMNGATKLLCVLASGPPNNSSIPTSPAPRSSCTAHSTPKLVPLTPCSQSQRSKLWREGTSDNWKGLGLQEGDGEREKGFVPFAVLFGVKPKGVLYTDLSQRRPGLEFIGRLNLLGRWWRECGDGVLLFKGRSSAGTVPVWECQQRGGGVS